MISAVESSKIILGTVQLGLPYGVNNTQGQPSTKEAFRILNLAASHGVTHLDTAAAYGTSEAVIGQYHQQQGSTPFSIITKFHFNKDEHTGEKVRKALEHLAVPQVDILLFHSYADFKNNPEVMTCLLEQKEIGAINKIGVSVYENAEVEDLLNYEEVEVIQLPFNLIDNEARRGGILREAKQLGKVIHTRSTFLQGLFFKTANTLPKKLMPLTPHLEEIKWMADMHGVSMATLALQYVVSKPYIDGVLIGVETEAQLLTNMNALTEEISKDLFRKIDQVHISRADLLNPSNWNN